MKANPLIYKGGTGAALTHGTAQWRKRRKSLIYKCGTGAASSSGRER